MSRCRQICFILALLTLAGYLPVVRHDFIGYDDPDYVTENHVVQAGLTPATIAWAFTTFHASNWHPLTWLSLELDCELFGPNPGALHIVNLLFHTANTVLLFLLLLRLTNATWPAAFVAATFAWHPLHVESVAWVAERKDVLSIFFGLLTLWTYCRYAAGQNLEPRTTKGKYYYGLALVCFALGLMSKPMLVTWPFLMLLLDYWPLSRFTICDLRFTSPPTVATRAAGRTAILLEKVPFFVLSAASCVITYLAQRSEAVVAFDRLPFGPRAANAVVSYARYLGKIFWPVNLAVIYPLPPHIPWYQILAAGVLIAGVSAIAWRIRRDRPWLLVGWFWFVGTLVPVIGLVQVGGQAMADRYAYLPSIGIFIILAYGVNDLARRLDRNVIGVFSGVALGVAFMLMEHQLEFWRDSETLFTHAIAVTRDNDIAQINLGVALESKGRSEDALPHYLEALRINPRRAEVQVDVANLLSAAGHKEEAMAHFDEALRLKPKSSRVHLNYAAFLAGRNESVEAVEQYAEAAWLDPSDPLPHLQMGKLCLRQGRSAEAIGHFQDVLKRDPGDVAALTYLARVLASDRNAPLRNGPQAVTLAGKANDLTSGREPFILDTLAMALAETGRFQDAEELVAKAVQMATSVGDTNMVASLQGHLRLYQAGRPCRDDFSEAGQ